MTEKPEDEAAERDGAIENSNQVAEPHAQVAEPHAQKSDDSDERETCAEEFDEMSDSKAGVESGEDEGHCDEVAPTEDDGHCDKNMHNKELGKRGEDAAAAFLVRRGLEIIERNWTCMAGEADIIAMEDDALHFVEVKTRRSECKGFPAEAVDMQKRKRYERIAECYLKDYEGPEGEISFDVISILVTAEHRAFLRYHRNAFSRVD